MSHACVSKTVCQSNFQCNRLVLGIYNMQYSGIARALRERESKSGRVFQHKLSDHTEVIILHCRHCTYMCIMHTMAKCRSRRLQTSADLHEGLQVVAFLNRLLAAVRVVQLWQQSWLRITRHVYYTHTCIVQVYCVHWDILWYTETLGYTLEQALEYVYTCVPISLPKYKNIITAYFLSIIQEQGLFQHLFTNQCLHLLTKLIELILTPLFVSCGALKEFVKTYHLPSYALGDITVFDRAI